MEQTCPRAETVRLRIVQDVLRYFDSNDDLWTCQTLDIHPVKQYTILSSYRTYFNKGYESFVFRLLRMYFRSKIVV